MTRAELLSLIMFDIGLPIIDAITKVIPLEDQERANASVAALLDKTVLNSEEIQDTLEIVEDDMANVYVRIGLASIAARIIALRYERTGKPPTEEDIKRYVSSLDTLQTFSDRYILSESLSKLYALESPEATRALRNMTKLTYLEHFAPLIDSVVTFSFGEPAKKMIQDVSEKLRDAAESVRIELLEGFYTENQMKASELSILKVMIDLYCTCHNAETNRIMALHEDARANEQSKIQIKQVWKSFDNKLSMLTVLSDSIMPNEETEPLDDVIKRIEIGDNKGDDAMMAMLGLGEGEKAKDTDEKDTGEDEGKGESDKAPKKSSSPLSFYVED